MSELGGKRDLGIINVDTTSDGLSDFCVYIGNALQAHALDTTGNGEMDSIAIDTDGDQRLDTVISISKVEYSDEYVIRSEPLLQQQRGRVSSERSGCGDVEEAGWQWEKRKQQQTSRNRLRQSGIEAFVRAGMFILALSGALAVAVAWCEDWNFARGLHITINALLSNGNGKHTVRHPVSRVFLSGASLLGLFFFVAWLVKMVPVVTGLELLSPQRDVTVAPIHSARWTTFDADGANGRRGSGGGDGSTRTLDTDATHSPWAFRFWAAKDSRRRRRFLRALRLWCGMMCIMWVVYFVDHLSATVGESGVERATMALMYAITTGCSGGFGNLSNDWLDAFFIVISVPLTAWLAAEFSTVSAAQQCELARATSSSMAHMSHARGDGSSPRSPASSPTHLPGRPFGWHSL